MRPWVWITARFSRAQKANGFDTTTLALLAPGRAAFRDSYSREQAVAHITEDRLDDVERELRAAVVRARPGDALTVEIPNARAAALESLTAGTSATNLTDLVRRCGLNVVDAYGIGYIPESLAKGKAFHRELIANPGVFASPDDCVLLAFCCRVPVDERS